MLGGRRAAARARGRRTPLGAGAWTADGAADRRGASPSRATPEQVRLVVDVDGRRRGRRGRAARPPPGAGRARSGCAVDATRLAVAAGRSDAGGPLPRLTARVSPCLRPAGRHRRRHGRCWRSSRRSSLDKRLVDPDGFLGPSWLRLPLLLARRVRCSTCCRARCGCSRLQPAADARDLPRPAAHALDPRADDARGRWGCVCFYITYVSYRNLKSFLPFVDGRGPQVRPRAAPARPGAVLRPRARRGAARRCSAPASRPHVLSYVYLWFLPLVPLALTAWLVWSRNITYGYWFATSQCLAWTPRHALLLRAARPSGPGFAYPCALHRPARHRRPRR